MMAAVHSLIKFESDVIFDSGQTRKKMGHANIWFESDVIFDSGQTYRC